MERTAPLFSSSFAARAGDVLLHASPLRCIRHPDIALLAIRSLHAELVLYPKPGLVSPWDNGSHDDMDAALFMRSLFSLRHYFVRMARAGAEAAPFAVLRDYGIAAEHTMLVATRGINTHRGAIFALGLLCAAVGYCRRYGRPFSPTMLRQALMAQWGAALAAHSAAPIYGSHGQRAAMRFAVGGAREEAAAGFPSLFEVALPRLRLSLASEHTVEEAQIDTFFSLMAHIDDTNIYTRGGMEGAALMRDCAQQFLSRGGTAHPDWRTAARDCHRQFVARRLSPGGAADLFAATWFVHQLEQAEHAAQVSVMGDTDG